MIAVYRPLGRARDVLETLIDIALPEHCASCGAAGELLCAACQTLLERAAGPRCRHCWLASPQPVCDSCRSRALPLRELRSAFVYDGPARAAVLALKNGGDGRLARALVDLAGEIRPASDINMIVPIPIPLLRRRRRGWNQAERLALAVSEVTGLTLDADALRKRGWWGPRLAQASSRAARRLIVADSFIAEPEHVRDRGILLIDDVATSMATLNEAARTLHEAGATAVDAWTVSRAV